MQFYNIKDSYINYLRQYDSKVSENKNERRPYVGIVLQIGNIKYYAPFSSPKPKHKNMSNGIDFRKIDGGKYGAINFNNMIPVPDSVLIPININNEPDVKYRNLLLNQYIAIRKDAVNIQNTAIRLHQLIFSYSDTLSERKNAVLNRCCNLRLLETIYDKMP